MTTVTSSMFKMVIVEVIFLTLMTGFEALFVGSQIGDTSNLSLTDILSKSWGVLTQPELVIVNAILIVVGLVVSLFVARELLPA